VINKRGHRHPTLMRGWTFTRPNVFEVDLDAIAHNARAVRRWVGPDPAIFAALKADAYGILPVARTLLASGVNAVSLVSLGDAIVLRQAGLSAPILLYAVAKSGRH
jgi:alanine racemase